jgi:hypothetical protein
MIRFSSENKNALTPGFVSTALEGITHRFLLVLECETRMYSEGQQPSKHAIVPPRFAIGGPRATIDPRVAKVEELMPLAKYKLQLPDGWEKVHQYIYVLQPSTDEHGWQYRSEWSNGPLTDKDEQWVRSNAPGLDVRRRLWMATVVSRDLVVAAKRRLAEAISSRVRGVIMEGTLFRQEQGALMKTWQKRHVVLTDDTIEIYTGNVLCRIILYTVVFMVTNVQLQKTMVEEGRRNCRLWTARLRCCSACSARVATSLSPFGRIRKIR